MKEKAKGKQHAKQNMQILSNETHIYRKPLSFENFIFSPSEKGQSPGLIPAECYCKIDTPLTQIENLLASAWEIYTSLCFWEYRQTIQEYGVESLETLLAAD